jgi:RES domain-containing protein
MIKFDLIDVTPASTLALENEDNGIDGAEMFHGPAPDAITSVDLPQEWSALPAPASTQEFGRQWLASASQLAMLVPSAIIPESINAVINPEHPAYHHVKLNVVREFSFDARMFK